jgi:site-specific recombinase XerD
LCVLLLINFLQINVFTNLTSIDLADVDFKRKRVVITEKGGQRRGCQVSTQGMNAIKDYLAHERTADAQRWGSPALFLPAMTVAHSAGRLAPTNINTIWKGVCQLAGLKGMTPHSARHGIVILFEIRTLRPYRYYYISIFCNVLQLL